MFHIVVLCVHTWPHSTSTMLRPRHAFIYSTKFAVQQVFGHPRILVHLPLATPMGGKQWQSMLGSRGRVETRRILKDMPPQEAEVSRTVLPAYRKPNCCTEPRGRHGFSTGGAGYGVASCATTGGVRKGGSQAMDGRSASYLPSSFACGRDPAEDDEALRRQQRLSTW